MMAKVYVDVKHRAVDRGYDYRVPDSLKTLIAVGMRVEIPFGNRTVSGFVTELINHSEVKKLKSIIRLLDATPLFSTFMLDLTQLLANQYLIPRIQYLQAMLPPAMRMTYQKQLILKDKDQLTKKLSTYFKNSEIAKFDDIHQEDLNLIRQAIDRHIIEPYTTVKQRQNPYEIAYVILKSTKEVKGHKQKAIINCLKEEGKLPKSDLISKTQASHATLNTLIKKDIVEVISETAYRERTSLLELKDKHVVLNQQQQEVYEHVINAIDQHQTYLLHGVTSSGKTEIYIKLAEYLANRDKKTLVLVPEISLTPQLTARFKAVFGQNVAVYHSRLTQGEQYDAWRKVKNEQATVIIGARSAIFLPVKQLGAIVIDEEHSESYHQQDVPRYHAKDIAKAMAKHENIPLILGSATPSVESYYLAKTHQYTLLELKTRALKSHLPHIELVNMKQEFTRGNKSMFSQHLQQAIKHRLEKNEQTLLLINRRGHANFILCRQCGKNVRCDACDLSMTYHHHQDKVKCHYCQRELPTPKQCPNCGSHHIRHMGIGTEKVEATLKQLYPQAKIYRMDRDTTTGTLGHEHILHAFEKDGDILLGTQMISKGLDFDRVTLVGVMSADMSLFVPDYYAQEETFSLLTQMAGRSGRRLHQGEVVIQAYDIDHPVLNEVQTQDYLGFYEREIAWRKKAQMPPFCKLTALTLTHENRQSILQVATKWLIKLESAYSKSVKLIGPVIPKISKINYRYRVQILIKHEGLLDIMKPISELYDKAGDAMHLHVEHHPRMN